jgi:hypothetical protein
MVNTLSVSSNGRKKAAMVGPVLPSIADRYCSSSPRLRLFMDLDLRITLVIMDVLHVEDFTGTVSVHEHDEHPPIGVHGS